MIAGFGSLQDRLERSSLDHHSWSERMLCPMFGEKLELGERESAEFTQIRRSLHTEVLQEMLE